MDFDDANSLSSSKQSAPMLTKFESKSARVKGLSFHPTRTWILAALHNGEIQLWDYVMSSLVARFHDHEGPVRGIDFHHSMPLFVSGGDDYLIKVWDYKLRRCLYTLQGHLDYIRTVEFHHEYPWIVSASDDQTVRIWNWQSREGISVLTGHNHYCMSASFHPKEDFVVSASLDQTVRVWDTSGLRKKTVRGFTPPGVSSSGMGGGGGMGPDDAASSAGKGDMFGSTDAVVKFVLEGHERGVNWAAFHPTHPLIVTGADDRQVKLWRMNDNKAWQVGPMRGHTNNVSCVLFHPRAEFIVSDSEDRTIRIWDMNKRACLKTFRRETDRFWILAAHPTRNLLAAGHDNGLLVFKLERERPAYDSFNGAVYRVKDGSVRFVNMRTGQETSLLTLPRDEALQSGVKTLLHPNSLLINRMNPDGIDLLICGPGNSIDVVCLANGTTPSQRDPSAKSGTGICAVFTARNRYAVLDEGHHIQIKNFSNEVVKKFDTPQPNTDWMFPGGLPGRVIFRAEDRVTLFDTQSQRIVHEVSASKIKGVVWSDDSAHVCLLSKRHVVVCTRDLEHCCTVSESVRVKSAAWALDGAILVYTTLKHVKYMLPNGDVGVLRSLEEPIYIVRVDGDSLLAIDRDGNMKSLRIDLVECKFKVALSMGRFKEVMHMIKHAGMCGEAIVGYLEDKGFPEVALHFVEDDANRFALAVECGQLAIARECAERLQDEYAWRRLGAEALKSGAASLAEICLQRTRDLTRLSFLYLVTGNTENLGKMQAIADRMKDPEARMHNAILRGDAAERVRVLEASGQLALALTCAETYGITEDAERLRQKLIEANIDVSAIPTGKKPSPPLPRAPTLERGGRGCGDWPLLEVPKGVVGAALAGEPDYKGTGNSTAVNDDMLGEEELEEDEGENENDDSLNPSASGNKMAQEEALAAWDDDDDLDLGDEEFQAPTPVKAVSPRSRGAEESAAKAFVTVQPGLSLPQRWAVNSTLAFDHAAGGSFETAMQMLNRQIGVVNFQPLKPLFLAAHASSKTLVPGPPSTAPYDSYLVRAGAASPQEALPAPLFTIKSVNASLPAAFDAFSLKKFDDALGAFRRALQSVALVVVESSEQALELAELMGLCREYVIACTLLLAGEAEGLDPVRSAELASYLTRRDLKPVHTMLVVKSAMVKTFKLENHIHAAQFAKRILAMPGIDLERNAKSKVDAQKVLQRSEREARNSKKMQYTEGAFELDVVDLLPLSNIQGAPAIKRCPFCQSTSAHQGTLCPVCELSPLGVETLGLVSMSRAR